MLRKSAAVLAVVLCLANVNATRAEPGPVVNWLMNEPASLFDVGMLRLDLWISIWGEHPRIIEIKQRFGSSSWAHPWYNFEENRIYVTISVHDGIDVDNAGRKAVCRELIDFMSRQAVVDPTTGKYVDDRLKVSAFAQRFEHRDYTKTSAPSDYQSRLDGIFVLRAFVGEDPRRTTCRRALMSNKVYFEE